MKFIAAIFAVRSSIQVASPFKMQNAGDVLSVVPLTAPQADPKPTVDQRSE
jgi:hypothetical protein